ncbi:hypothetical protein ACE1CD_15480 [Aerosakkonema sp. BLCC-F183]|uniref:hypothetical protein n=1 Tax=Aerosakkonema sp. BLCC-F183 TaxID=3342834 RepID=UPI0035BA838F
MIIEFESIPVHFWVSGNGFRYWPETGYRSEVFDTLGKAIASAKLEVNNLVAEFGCLPMFPSWEVYWKSHPPEEF